MSTVAQERLLKIIYGPHVTEKNTVIAEKYRQVAFRVARCANKHEIKNAVEALFEVKVDAVRVCNVKGKVKQFKQRLGKQGNWKKAYVSLKEGHDIDFTGIK